MVLMIETPRSERFDDVYFSAADGAEETKHVFFDGNNLPAAWQGRSRFTIAETGFGTGLNFLLAWELFERTADGGAFLDNIKIEKYPLKIEEMRKALLPWADKVGKKKKKLLAQYPILVPGFHRIVFDNRVALTLIFGDVNEILPEVVGGVDAWFLDGFTPAKNPDMWTDVVFHEMARLSHSKTTFATFTAAGFVKRGLQAAGFAVEKKKGFGWKRDMLAGSFSSDKKSTEKPKPKTVHILGAGLAGCSCTYVLKQYGLEPVLYDPNGIASGASGNPLGLINPRFTAFRTPESDFYTAAYAQTVRSFVDSRKCGTLHLIVDEDKEKRLTRTAENWGWDSAHMRLVDASEASEIAGVTINYPALFLPDSAQVNPSLLCRFYVQGMDVEQTYTAQAGDVVVHANGFALPEELPVHTVRGQITFVESNTQSSMLKTNLSYGGYISACRDGTHVVGSTFQKWLAHTDPLYEDDKSNLATLEEFVPAIGNLKMTGQRAALRVSAKDRFPVVGLLENGQLVTTAHGSHGIATTLAGAHLMADYLRGGPFSLGKSTLNSLSPARFRKKS